MTRIPGTGERSLARRFLALPAAERRALGRAWCELLRADLQLRLSPRAALAAALAADPRSGGEQRVDEAVVLARQVASTAAHHLWSISCLPRSLALWRMLRARGIPARIRIGLRATGDPLPAHAWVEVAGSPLGEPEGIDGRFSTLEAPDRLPPVR